MGASATLADKQTLAVANEIELKLRIRAQDLPRLRKHPAVLAALIEKPVTRRLASHYYDTPALDLLDAGLSLRVRRMSGGWFQAVKAAGHSLGGLHQRMEWEDIIAHGEPDFSKITDPALTRIFDQPELRAALRPIFTTDVRRTEWQLAPAPGSHVEMALDVGDLIVGEQREPICEVELELKAGAAAALFNFALALQQDIPLWIENVSKAQRGYGHYRPEPAGIRRAKPVRLFPDMALHEAARAMLWECLIQLQGNQAAALEGHDIEGVHQMRVALRRMRSAMSLFAAHMPPAPDIVADIKWLATALGTARDLDVFLAETLPPLLDIPDQPGLATLKAHAVEAQSSAYSALREALESQRIQRWLLRLGAWLETLETPADAPSLRQHAHQLLRKRHRKLRRHAEHWQALSAEERHAVRIEAKKLRYAAEFLASLYPDHAVERFLRPLTRLLDSLGTLNDMAVTDRLVRQLCGPRPGGALREMPALLQGWSAARSIDQRTHLDARWHALLDARPFWV
jgi:inorganic triphosphatase YgiF